MKVIGLIGGMSWESSLEYYRIINERVKEKLGGLHSAKSLMFSVDFQEIEQLQHRGDWNGATMLMIDAAKRLELGGADMIVICTNTRHKMADDIQKNTPIPLIHIADATAEKVMKSGMKRVGLIGTKFTMEENFYKGRLIEKYGLDVIIPDEEERQMVHDTIYKELCLGIINQNSREKFTRVIENLARNGAEGVILGCTEIPLLVRQEDVKVQLFDTTCIHAKAAADYALEN
jgi:aspartate racemase